MEVLSVSQVNHYIKSLMDRDTLLSDITVTGEISNFKRHSSGHYYFSVKDAGAAISAAMFKWANRSLRFMPENGMRVLVKGRISVYEPSGQYQIIVSAMEPDGVGALYEQYEKMRRELEQKGYFDPSRKKPLPPFPRRIGVITSPTGAAVRDIVTVLGRRFPLAKVELYPSSVQGEAAPAELAAAVEAVNREGLCDVIILGRGGGSIEDLWAFNSREVVRAVIRSRLPIISAVGHETDFTLCDFVADMRAPTPSAAAELAVPDSAGVRNYLRHFEAKSYAALTRKIQLNEARLAAVKNLPAMRHPMVFTENKARQLDELVTRMNTAMNQTISDCDTRLRETASRLAALNPLAVLGRGYAVAYRQNVPVRSVTEMGEGDVISLRLADGTADCTVNRITREGVKENGKCSQEL